MSLGGLILLALSTATIVAAAESDWLKLVAPIMTRDEKAQYLTLSPAAKAKFEQSFWATKSITKEEYFERLRYIDTNFGSGKAGSGANTDQGRVYLSLGPPNRVTRLPSSRSFFPLEIWYYETAPALNLTSELRLIFYLRNGLGYYKLYSPTVDTIRALLTPQANTIGMFDPNQNITQANIQTQLTTRPAENEVAEAAVSVSPGITNEGNDEIIAKVLSPAVALSNHNPHSTIRSRLLLAPGQFYSIQTKSPYGGMQIDFMLATSVQRSLRLAVMLSDVPVYQSELHFHFDQRRKIRYLHRLDLLPGRYSLLFTIDGSTYGYPLEVLDTQKISEILRVDDCTARVSSHAPFEFSEHCFCPASDGRKALLVLPYPAPVSWVLRRGMEAIWKEETSPAQIASVDLPLESLPYGVYTLDASAGDESRTQTIEIQKSTNESVTAVSYNANLASGKRLAFLAHQYLLRGDLDQARRTLSASLSSVSSGNDEVWIELSRLKAIEGRYDDARMLVKPVLAAHPNNFDALTTMAFIEVKLQDYPVARSLYNRALAVQDSPYIRTILAKLPR